MIKGVHDIYSEVLNMKISYEPEHWTSMDCKGVVIGLHWSEGGGDEIPTFPRDSNGAHCGGTLTLSSFLTFETLGAIYCCFMYFFDMKYRMKIAIFFILILVVITTGLLFYERYRFRGWVKSGHQKIKVFTRKNNPVNPESLPPLLQNYLKRVILQIPSGSYVRFTQAGDFRMKPEEKMSTFKAEQFVSVITPMFSWVADIQMNHLPVTVCDRLIDGQGELQARLFSSIPLAKGSGDRFLRGELLRYLAELPWYPMGILNQPGIVWNQTEEKKVTGSISIESVSATVEYTFNEENLIQSIFVLHREKTDGKNVEQKPWLGEFSQYEERGGVIIPVQGQVSWLLESGKFTYFIGNIISYSVDEN